MPDVASGKLGGRRSRTHDVLVRQAIYNTGANVFVVIAGFGIVALYWVLESFFQPLVWAILCGAFLHPFKYSLTKNIKSWLCSLKASATPISIGVVLVPLNILDGVSERLIQAVLRRWRVILLVFVVFTTLYVTYLQAPMDFKQFTALIWNITKAVSQFISFFSFKWVCGIIVTYLLTVIKFWSPENKSVFGYMAIPIWVLTLLCLISNAGELRLPLAVIIIGLIAVGIYTDAKESRGRLQLDIGIANIGAAYTPAVETADADAVFDSPDVSQPAPDVHIVHQFTNFSDYVMTSFNRSISWVSGAPLDAVDADLSDAESVGGSTADVPPIPTASTPQTISSTSVAGDITGDIAGNDQANGDQNLATPSDRIADDTTSAALASKQPSKVKFSDKPPSVRQRSEDSSPPHSPQESQESSPPSSPLSYSTSTSIRAQSTGVRNRPRKESDRYFVILFWAIVLVTLWSNVRLILLPFIAVIYKIIKLTAAWLRRSFTEEIREHLRGKVQPLEDWCRQRLEVIVPPPIRAVVNILLKGDRKLLELLLRSADSVITVLLIILLLVGFVVLSIWFCFQVQREGIHLITLTSNLVQNSTVESKWLSGILRNGGPNDTVQNIHSSLDPMIQSVYTLGREYIVSVIDERVAHRQSRVLLRTELINIWDSLYASWVNKNTTMIAKPNYNGALFSHIRQAGLNDFWHTVSIDYSSILDFIRENIGLVQSVMESLWVVLKGNLNLAFTVFITVLEFILGGGTAILNSLVSMAVFFTTLFYLLASSSKDYTPVEWITSLTIAKSGSKFAQAVEDGIGGVFAASLKMAAFYGVYTWLTHTVFGINIVFLPAALASVLGAIPFVGTYWAALPAVLELCFIHREVFLGVLLAVFHVLPTFVVDVSLYSDIKGGGHPYLTGLAIAGGIYCFGLQGAIIGPVLLCCIIVAMNLYSAFINSDAVPFTPLTPGPQTLLNRHSNPFLTSIRRSLSSYDI